nr:cellulase family glycosylhydrolase [Candidatus Sigynarchaeota archaeon]
MKPSIQLRAGDLPRLHPRDDWFVDSSGRVAILRGVNLGGDCKVPYTPDGSTSNPTDFSDHRKVSFIGRPFPLEVAAEHFTRLKSWGFNVLRLLTTWEAVEHAGPGELDTRYIDYYTTLCKMAGDYGLYVFVDFHQDVWSRMTGGDGAPCWLFEKMGIDYTKLSKAGAALVMQHAFDFNDPRPRQEDNYPTMCWGQNHKYAGNGIMWTLFFGGKDFAPGFTIDGQNVQAYMQGHYMACQKAIGERVKDLPNVLGFDSLNEPNSGWIGVALDDRHVKPTKNNPALPGIAFSPVEALYSSHGYPVSMPFLALRIAKLGIVPVKDVIVNKDKVSIWLDGKSDPFQAAGAWSITADGRYQVDRNDHFQVVNGRQVDFTRDYMVPFINRVAENVQSINPDWMVFGEKDPKETVYDESFPSTVPRNFVNASHWYDNAISGTKKVRKITLDVVKIKLVVGKKGIQAMYSRQLGAIKNAATRVHAPALIGEFGLHMDLDGGKAYEQWRAGDRSGRPWKNHVWALDLMYNAMDQRLLSCTHWNYTAHNRNDLRIGDCWNQEDLSIYCIDQRDNPGDINSGGRALKGIVRPFARFVQGVPQHMVFDMEKGTFVLEFLADRSIAAPTSIYIPRIQYPEGYRIDAAGLDVVDDKDGQMATFNAKNSRNYTIHITRQR